MVDAVVLKQLRIAMHSNALLYVEDNLALSQQVVPFLQKVFDHVYVAHDGEEGLKLFQHFRPSIVITDITMPNMDGFELAKAIAQIDSDVKIIVTSAYDEVDYLHQAIRLGIFDFLTKPLKIEMLVDTLLRCSEHLKEELHRRLFYSNLHAIFNYQNALVILLQGRKMVMANQPCLDFFEADTVGSLKKTFENFGGLLLEHNSFLYNHDTVEWYDEVVRHPTKLFNIKIANAQDENCHFILRYQSIPEKEGFGVLSLNDVSELGLLKIYDASAVEQERLAKDKKIVRNVLEMTAHNGVKIKIHNLYKGLSITNDALVESVSERNIILKTPYVQLKAIQHEELFYLSSELFPMAILCERIMGIDLDEQTVRFSSYRMVQTSPITRASIRLVPDEKVVLTLWYEGHKYDAELSINDISINGIRFTIPTLPSGFGNKQKVILDIVISMGLRPVIINTAAEVFRIQEIQNRFEVVVVFTLHGGMQKNLIDYIAKRQMVLIREFKGLQYER